tara:strand:- start:3561 stop:3797 length:237 start_codon:yes stop_codon:yes gene_type:complete
MTKSIAQLQQHYRQIFESPPGKAVLEDLRRITNQTRVSSDSPNPYSAVYVIAQQQLLRRIENMCKERSAVLSEKEHII